MSNGFWEDDVKKVETEKPNREGFWEADVAPGMFEQTQKVRKMQRGMNLTAQAVRGAAPVIGTAFGFTPAAPLGFLVGGGLEGIAQGIEQVAGSRNQMNPYSVATAGLANIALPKMTPLEWLASRSRRPGTWGAIAAVPEGMIQSTLFSAASGFGEQMGGEEYTSPEQSALGVAMPAISGGLTSFIGHAINFQHFNRMAKDKNYARSSARLYSSIQELPHTGPEAEVAMKSFDTWFPIMHDFVSKTGAHPTSVSELRNASEMMDSAFYGTYQRLIGPLKHRVVLFDPSSKAPGLADRIKSKLISRYPELDDISRVRTATTIENEVKDLRGGHSTVDNLLAMRERWNQELEDLQKAREVGEGRAPGLRKDILQEKLKATRDMLNETLDSAYSGNVDAKKFLRIYKSVHDMTEGIRWTDQTLNAEKKLKAGTRFPLIVDVAQAARRSSSQGTLRSLGGASVGKIGAFFNKPDTMVKDSFKLLKNITPTYDLPIKGDPLASFTPQKALPPRGGTSEGRLGGIPARVGKAEVTRPSFLERGVEGEVHPSQRFQLIPSETPPAPRLGEKDLYGIREGEKLSQQFRETARQRLSLPAWTGEPTITGPTPEQGIGRGGPRRFDLGTGVVEPAPEPRLGELPAPPASIRESFQRLQDIIYPNRRKEM